MLATKSEENIHKQDEIDMPNANSIAYIIHYLAFGWLGLVLGWLGPVFSPWGVLDNNVLV